MILKPEDQVSSFELSKILRELGVKQESYFYWCKIIGTNKWEVSRLGEDQIKSWLIDEIAVSAFTVAELGEGLPEDIPDGADLSILIMCKQVMSDNKMYYVVGYGENIFKDIKEADARAKARIFLIEQGIITP
jgi:hypothetical protein